MKHDEDFTRIMLLPVNNLFFVAFWCSCIYVRKDPQNIQKYRLYLCNVASYPAGHVDRTDTIGVTWILFLGYLFLVRSQRLPSNSVFKLILKAETFSYKPTHVIITAQQYILS